MSLASLPAPKEPISPSGRPGHLLPLTSLHTSPVDGAPIEAVVLRLVQNSGTDPSPLFPRQRPTTCQLSSKTFTNKTNNLHAQDPRKRAKSLHPCATLKSEAR